MRPVLRSMILAVCLASFSASQGFLGTKSGGGSVSPVTEQSSGAMPLLQMGLALAFVLGLMKVCLPKLVTKFGKKLSLNATSNLVVEESATFPGGTLYIVRARHKTLLLGVGNGSISCLADITKSEAEPEVITFKETVNQAILDEIPVGTAVVAIDPEQEAAERALERLTRLGL